MFDLILLIISFCVVAGYLYGDCDGCKDCPGGGGEDGIWRVVSVGSCCGGTYDSFTLVYISSTGRWSLSYCASGACSPCASCYIEWSLNGSNDSRVNKVLSLDCFKSPRGCETIPSSITIVPKNADDWEFVIAGITNSPFITCCDELNGTWIAEP